MTPCAGLARSGPGWVAVCGIAGTHPSFIAALVVVPKVVHVAERQAVVLASAGVCALAVAAVAAVQVVRHRRRGRARDDARVLAALRQNSLRPSEAALSPRTVMVR